MTPDPTRAPEKFRTKRALVEHLRNLKAPGHRWHSALSAAEMMTWSFDELVSDHVAAHQPEDSEARSA